MTYVKQCNGYGRLKNVREKFHLDGTGEKAVLMKGTCFLLLCEMPKEKKKKNPEKTPPGLDDDSEGLVWTRAQY